jgi:cobalt-zinc-cadmium efflux system protein
VTGVQTCALPIFRFTGWTWVDPLIAVAIALWVLPRTWTLLRESVNVLLEGVPDGFKLADIAQALRGTPGVQEVHELHVWAISSGKPSLSAHLLLNAGADAETVRVAASAALRAQFGLRHSTLQCEFTPCDSDDCTLAGHPTGNLSTHRHGDDKDEPHAH